MRGDESTGEVEFPVLERREIERSHLDEWRASGLGSCLGADN